MTIRCTGLAPWEFEFHFPGSLTSTFLDAERDHCCPRGGHLRTGCGSPAKASTGKVMRFCSPEGTDNMPTERFGDAGSAAGISSDNILQIYSVLKGQDQRKSTLFESERCKTWLQPNTTAGLDEISIALK